MAENLPAVPPAGKIAGSNIGERLVQWIGEIDPDSRRHSGYAHAGCDESEVLRLYWDTLRNERCQAVLHQRLDAAKSRPWEVEPGGDMRRDKVAAEEPREQLAAVGFDGACRQLLHGVWYGYAVAEAIREHDGARVGLADLKVRAPDRFRWNAAGELLLRTEGKPQGEAVPDAKFITLARPGEHGELCRREGIGESLYYSWSKEFLEAGKKRLSGDTARQASSGEVKDLRREMRDLKEALGEQVLENRLLKKSMTGDGGDSE